jgi:aminoglycoside 6'-N-acetyltransferase
MTDSPDVALGAFDPDRHLSLLDTWLCRPHVARWWGEPERALAAVLQRPRGGEALIMLDARAVGFVCWQTLSKEERSSADLEAMPDGLVDVDILIGEPDVVGRGVGPAALRLVLSTLKASGVPVVALAAAMTNQRALSAYVKVGFRAYRDFHAGGERMRYFVKTLDAAL